MFGSETFIVRVAEDAMAPRLRADDYVWIDLYPSQDPSFVERERNPLQARCPRAVPPRNELERSPRTRGQHAKFNTEQTVEADGIIVTRGDKQRFDLRPVPTNATPRKMRFFKALLTRDNPKGV